MILFEKEQVRIVVEYCRSLTVGCKESAVTNKTASALKSDVEKLAGKFNADRLADSVHIPPHRIFRISLAMCPNACTRPQIADFGIIGAAKPQITDGTCTGCGKCIKVCREHAVSVIRNRVMISGNCLNCGACAAHCRTSAITTEFEGFRILLGGKLGRHPMLAKELPGIYSPQEVMVLLAFSLEYYLKNRDQYIRFGDLVSRNGFSWLPSDLISPFS